MTSVIILLLKQKTKIMIIIIIIIINKNHIIYITTHLPFLKETTKQNVFKKNLITDIHAGDRSLDGFNADDNNRSSRVNFSDSFHAGHTLERNKQQNTKPSFASVILDNLYSGQKFKKTSKQRLSDESDANFSSSSVYKQQNKLDRNDDLNNVFYFGKIFNDFFFKLKID